MSARAPGGVHVPVLLAETVAALAVRPEGTYVDATFGRGGHARAILARLGPSGRLVALDRDPQAVAAADAIGDARLSAVHAPFSELAQVLARLGIAQVQGVLADLGMSSAQLDDPARGFSLRADGPLDMRMDPTRGAPVSDWLRSASEQEIREAIRSYGEERFAKQIAKAIVAARAREPLVRTRQLAEVVAAALGARHGAQDAATRTFQALRILVNRELEEVSLMLPQALGALAPGGRLAVLSFHSLEDRLVKRFLKACAAPELPRDLPLRASEMPQPCLRIVGRAQRATAAEVAANPRARSATLRVAERTAAPIDRSTPNRIEPDAWRG
jgi:16S rRNA (cytosine1402-N4)-methyltransferase